MTKVKKEELKIGLIVYYIPSHEDKLIENSERGTVSTIRNEDVWVRYTDGDTGAKTDIQDLYI